MRKQQFDVETYPKTFAYVIENDTFTRRCNMCGSVVLREASVPGYPYQCMLCDENLYEIETHIGEYHTDEEFDELCCDTLELLLLDDVSIDEENL